MRHPMIGRLIGLVGVLMLAGIPSSLGAQAGAAQFAPVGPIHRISATTVTSSIWSGYAASGTKGQFNAVSSSWSVPTATCGTNETSYSSAWVGLDGYNSRTVEQIGTDSDCVNGVPNYYAWYEMYPKRAYLVPLTLSSGNAITASVSYANGRFTLTLNGFTVTLRSPSAKRSSAEVIVEAPSSNPGPFGALPLADFGTVYFTGATVNSGTLGASNPDELIMQVGTTVEAYPSGITDGNSFSVTWGEPAVPSTP